MSHKTKPTPLYQQVEQTAKRYFESLDDAHTHDVYATFLAEFEKPLLIAALNHTHGNQSKTAQILGINRGTLRTKMKTHHLL